MRRRLGTEDPDFQTKIKHCALEDGEDQRHEYMGDTKTIGTEIVI